MRVAQVEAVHAWASSISWRRNWSDSEQGQEFQSFEFDIW